MPGEEALEETFTTPGAHLCLITMEQFIDENPWDGFASGHCNSARGQLLGVNGMEHRYDVTIGPLSLQLGATVRLASPPMRV